MAESGLILVTGAGGGVGGVGGKVVALLRQHGQAVDPGPYNARIFELTGPRSQDMNGVA
jgi:hypothetical protein